MQQTLTPTSEAVATEAVAQATSHAESSCERLIQLFAFAPDDKLAWAPSPTSKSSLRIVAHCALTNAFFADTISGNLPENMPSPEEFFNGLHNAEQKTTTRESAIELLRETTAQLCAAIGSVNAESMASTPDSPFGPIPMPFWMSQGGEHMAYHAGQLAYLQTIWGDLDNHMG